MWTHDGVWHRFDAGGYSIGVLASDHEPFGLATDVEVASAGRRWSATFITPEQIRECLTRWSTTGESLGGTYFWMPDGIVVAELTLTTIEQVVRDHLTNDGSLNPPFMQLEEQEPEPH